MERTLGFGLGGLRGEFAQFSSTDKLCGTLVVSSSAARRQAHMVATHGSPNPFGLALVELE